MNEKLNKEAKKINNKLNAIYKELFKKKNVIKKEQYLCGYEDQIDIVNDTYGNGVVCTAYFDITNKKNLSKFKTAINKYFKTLKTSFNILYCGFSYFDDSKYKGNVNMQDLNGNKLECDWCNKRITPTIMFRVMERNENMIKSTFCFSHNKDGYGTDCFTSDKQKEQIKKFIDKNGFSSAECWNLSETIARFILPRLIHLKKIHHGLFWKDPFDKKNNSTLSEKETDEVYNKMIKVFEYAAFKQNLDYSAPDKKELDGYKEGLELFAKYFFELWD